MKTLKNLIENMEEHEQEAIAVCLRSLFKHGFFPRLIDMQRENLMSNWDQPPEVIAQSIQKLGAEQAVFNALHRLGEEYAKLGELRSE